MSINKTKRVENILIEKGVMSTHQIQERFNVLVRWGISMNELGNILSKNKIFEKVAVKETFKGGRRRYSLWQIRSDTP